MHLICSYCGRYINEKKPFESTNLTHGLCLDCFVPTSMLTCGVSYDEYIETCDVPAIILNSRHQVLAANGIAMAMLGKPIENLKGMLAGEALECPNSKLPDGCGRTIHCQTCTVRILIQKTLKLAISHHHELVSLETANGRSDFLVSTIFYDDLIQISFEDSWTNRDMQSIELS